MLVQKFNFNYILNTSVQLDIKWKILSVFLWRQFESSKLAINASLDIRHAVLNLP